MKENRDSTPSRVLRFLSPHHVLTAKSASLPPSPGTLRDDEGIADFDLVVHMGPEQAGQDMQSMQHLCAFEV